MSKSYVSMENAVCPVCTKQHNFNCGILLDNRRLKESMEATTLSGYGLCEECNKLKEEDYIALIEIDEEKSGDISPGSTYGLENVYRTGRIIHMKKEMYEAITEGASLQHPFAFINEGLYNKLLDLYNNRTD